MAAELRRFDDLDALSRAAADELIALAREAISARGACHLALAGGTTPRRLYALLAATGRDALPWGDVELWFGDERTVAPDAADANYRMVREALIAPLGIAADRVHRLRGEDPDPAVAAHDYERALVRALGSPPILDIALLGMGADGHTASLFPHTPALAETARWVVANPVDSPLTNGQAVRLTLTAPVFNAARHVRFVVAGADKANALAAVLQGASDPDRYPAQRIAPRGGDVGWFVDAAAAAQLGGSR
jgi:6-phosphogluconolactonase